MPVWISRFGSARMVAGTVLEPQRYVRLADVVVPDPHHTCLCACGLSTIIMATTRKVSEFDTAINNL
jgi:hypothetical protein